MSEKLLHVTQVDFWWRDARESRLERVLNWKINEITGISHIITHDVRTKQLIWYVQAMGELNQEYTGQGTVSEYKAPVNEQQY